MSCGADDPGRAGCVDAVQAGDAEEDAGGLAGGGFGGDALAKGLRIVSWP
jgi:hypothetical protein